MKKRIVLQSIVLAFLFTLVSFVSMAGGPPKAGDNVMGSPWEMDSEMNTPGPVVLKDPLWSYNVGIGVDGVGATQKLTVNGVVYSINGGFMFPDGTTQISKPLVEMINGFPTISYPNSSNLVSGLLKLGTGSLSLGSDNGGLDNYIYSTDERLRINANEGQGAVQYTTINEDGGRVGIGTDNPQEIFQIGDEITIHNGGTKCFARNFNYIGVDDMRKLVDGPSGGYCIDANGKISISTAPSGMQGDPFTWNRQIEVLNSDNAPNGTGLIKLNSDVELNGFVGSSDDQIKFKGNLQIGIVPANISDNSILSISKMANSKDLLHIGAVAMTMVGSPPMPVLEFASKFIVDNQGKVGIGTSSPTKALEVNGMIYSSDAQNGGFMFPDGSVQTTAASGSGGWAVQGDDVITGLSGFGQTGRVGIGTETPDAALHIKSNNSNNSSEALRLEVCHPNNTVELVFADKFNNPTNSRSWVFRGMGTNSSIPNGMRMISSKGGPLSIEHAKVIIGVNDNTSIQTISQDEYMLNVNGTIRAKEIHVKTDWADYVFNKDYNLMPLNDVEKYINLNGHLPNVQDGEEIECNGFDVGAMNSKLMEKVEELTLYIIEQNKRIENLEKIVKDH